MAVFCHPHTLHKNVLQLIKVTSYHICSSGFNINI